jgi:hypothetical protein
MTDGVTRLRPAASDSEALEFVEPGEDDAGAMGELGIVRVGKRVDGGGVHVHRRIGHPNDYWSFTIIWRRISHCHSILSRTSNASDGQIATLRDLGRPNRNPS